VGALHGDFGQSLSLNRPVAELLAERLPQTLSWPGWRLCCRCWRCRPCLPDRLYALATVEKSTGAVASPGFSVPVFWMGLLLIQVFAFGLGWFPATGSRGVESLVLPAITLAIPARRCTPRCCNAVSRGVAGALHRHGLCQGLEPGQVQARHASRPCRFSP
jgi:peptide/nickel transport system permease protein